MLITRPQKYKKSSNKPTRMRGAIILPPVPLISLPPASFTICPNLSDFHGRNAIPSGISWLWPEQRHFDIVSSGERAVWPDGKALDTVLSGEKRVWPDGNALGGCRSPAKDTPRTSPSSVMFWSRKHIQIGNSASMPFGHLRSGPSTVSCVPLRGTCLRRTPTHYIRRALKKGSI